jgi:hypothetical protein
MIDLAVKHVVNRRSALSQAQGRQVRVVVVDHRGRAVSDAEVSAWSGGTNMASGITGSSGEALLSLPPGSYDIRTVFGSRGYTFWSKVSSDDIARGGDVFVDVPVCASQPLINTAEGATLLVGAVIIAAGFYWKAEPARVVGEVLVGAAIFTSLYRISCL